MADRVTFYLDKLFDFWNDVPQVALEFPTYGWEEREDYLIDSCTMARMDIADLKELRDTFTSKEEVRYQDLLALITKNQQYMDQINIISEQHSEDQE